MSNLNLNPRNITNAIKDFCSINYQKLPTLSPEVLENGVKRTQFNIEIDGKSCVFIVYIKTNGKVSIQIQGQDTDWGNQIKQYVIGKCQISDNYQYNISIPYTESFFYDFLEYLKKCGAVEKIKKIF